MTDLVAWNRLADANVIRPGQKIELSGHLPADAGNPAGQGGDRTYGVKAGDTLHGIALAHNTGWKGIQLANSIADVNAIRVGQTLLIPDNPH